MIYIESGSTEPAFNLALEQYAFDTLARGSAGTDRADEIVMLWQNRDSVIIGLHQDAEQEVNRDFIDSLSIPVVRRLSGGGAVFHDLGNLNFTFIKPHSDAAELDFELSSRPIIDALGGMGVPVEFGGNNDIAVGGKKFSGTARYYKDGLLMHHGTLLFDTDLEKMEKALRVPDEKLVSKGIKSVRARVVNLREYLDMTMEEFWEEVRSRVVGDVPCYALSDRDLESVELIRRERYSTQEWNYGVPGAFE